MNYDTTSLIVREGKTMSKELEGKMKMILSKVKSNKEMSYHSQDLIKCHLCNDTGWIDVKVEGNIQPCSKPCKCRKEEIQAKRLKFANLPDTFKDVYLSNFNINVYQNQEQISVACNLIKIYVDNLEENLNAGIGLYIYSNTPGSGKTRMLVSLANEFLKKEIQVKFATSMTIISEIKDTWNKGAEIGESQLLSALINTKVLMIDDFGAEKYTECFEKRFYHIINERYINKKPTFFTSNVELDNLEYDDRIKNRVLEVCYQIHFPEESLRKYIANENQRKIQSKLKELRQNC